MSKDKSNKNSYAYLTIVAIVAIVGIIVLVWSAKSPSMMSSVNLPTPAVSDSALAGQGYSTGTYGHEYQLYNSFSSDGSVVSYLVDNGNWIYLDTRDASGIQSNAPGSYATYSGLLFTNLNPPPSPFSSMIELKSSCKDYIIKFGSSGFEINSTGVSDSFIVSSNGPQPIRQIAGTDDAITIHSHSQQVSWFTLHCDERVITSSSLRSTPPFIAAIDDSALASDNLFMTDIVTLLTDQGYAIVNAARLFSEVEGNSLDNQVTLVILNGRARVIIGDNSPASHNLFAVDVARAIADVQGRNLVKLSSEVDSNDLETAFRR